MEGLLKRLQLWKAKITDLEESMKLHFESSLNDTSTLNEADQVSLYVNMEVAVPLPPVSSPVVVKVKMKQDRILYIDKPFDLENTTTPMIL